MSAKVKIDLSAADQGTEIMLVDAFLNRVESSIGTLSTRVEPGVYKARFITGSTMKDVLLDATEPGGVVTYTQAAMEFPSAAPMEVSMESSLSLAPESGPRVDHRIEQKNIAERTSWQVHATPGHGSFLFLFIRESDGDKQLPSLDQVSVLTLDGTRIADMQQGEVHLAHNCAALSLELDPGTYRLRVDGQSAGAFEMFVTTTPGWQTQIYQRIEEFHGREGIVPSPALRSASVLMVRGQGYNAARPDMRLTELAKMGLIRGRQVIQDKTVEAMMRHEGGNPLLGLFAAHFYLMDERGHIKHRAILREILTYLEQTIPAHPDVLALRLGVDPDRNAGQLEAPPMLRNSWDLVADLPQRREETLKPGSAIQQMAPYAIGSRPWLLFESPTRTVDPQARTSVKQALQSLQDLMATDKEKLIAALGNKDADQGLSNLQHALLRNLASVSYLKNVLSGPRTQDLPVTAETAQQLFDSIAAPASTKADAVQGLAERLKGEPSA